MGCSDLKPQGQGKGRASLVRRALPWLEGERDRGRAGQTTFLEFSFQLVKS